MLKKEELSEVLLPTIGELVRQWNADGILYEDQLFLDRPGMRGSKSIVSEILAEHGALSTNKLECGGHFISWAGDFHCYYNHSVFTNYDDIIQLLVERHGS